MTETETGAESTPEEEQSGLNTHGDVDLSGLDRILDIPLVVSVELGRTSIPIGDLLQLAQGSVVELTKLAGEPLDVLVHGKLVARGEAVVINDQFGVRLTDIVSQTERIESLKGA